MRAGISGHQDLGGDEQRAWVASAIRSELLKNEISVGISSLAAGADQVFANLVLETQRTLEVIIPCRGYKRTFPNAKERAEFDALKARATHSQVLEFETPSEKAFYCAGQRIVDSADMMLFVWNGKPAKGLGGTADIVKYAKQTRRPYVHINPIKMQITRG